MSHIAQEVVRNENSQLICGHCGGVLQVANNFCPNCGRRTDRSTQYSDFEIGKLAALDSIKSDFIKWIGGISVIITILGLFGFSKLVELEKKKQISNIIDNTNFALVFNKLKFDLFRIKDIALSVEISFNPASENTRVKT
jgi:hypothetical protein